MLVYGNLERAALELLASDPSAAGDKFTGRLWLNTTEVRAKFYNGAALIALLANDQKLVLGTSGTASTNIRLNRAGTGVLQVVTGDDVTAEGSLSTALAQLSFKFETYTNAGLPAAGRAGRVAWVSDLLLLKYDNGSNWLTFASGSEGLASSGPATDALPYTIQTADAGKVFLYDTTSAAGTLTLPTSPASGFKFSLKDKGGAFATNNLTIARAAAESIEGVAGNYICAADYGVWHFFYDGTNWWIL